LDDLKLRVASRSLAAESVLLLDLQADAQNKSLPAFAPGAHIELQLPNGLRRHYSLCNTPDGADHYQIAVGLADASRGGSSYIHQSIATGDVVVASVPRNNFPLTEDAERYQFIAGGIGITPILPMIRWCEANGRDWRLIYLLRSRARAAFLRELECFGDRIRVHFDDEAGGVFDIRAALSSVTGGTHIYCCGPAPLMEAVESATAGRDPALVHFEWFSPRDQTGRDRAGFTVILARSGRRIAIPAGKTILETLEAHSLSIPFSCREGLCATCETAVLDGTPDHRDQILTPDERDSGKVMMICVSRALTDTITLDL
jgi:vanillate O-demethylase ferredoxin subunit